MRCECSHEYIDPMPDDDEISRMYGEEYFAEGGEWVGGFWEGSYTANEANLRSEAVEALALLGAPGRLLEIGCAGGFFLDEARKAGFDVSGVELNEKMAAHAREELGLDVQCALIEAADLPERSFDYVVTQDVLEHIRDVQEFVGGAAKLLRPGGALVVRGPLHATAKSRIYEAIRKIRGNDRVVEEPPYHLQGFTPASFHKLMISNGLSVEHFEAGSFRSPLRGWSVKEAIGGAIELTGYAADKWRGGGSFMEARARFNRA